MWQEIIADPLLCEHYLLNHRLMCRSLSFSSPLLLLTLLVTEPVLQSGTVTDQKPPVDGAPSILCPICLILIGLHLSLLVMV